LNKGIFILLERKTTAKVYIKKSRMDFYLLTFVVSKFFIVILTVNRSSLFGTLAA
jgi:hypothetical protein